LTDKKVDADRLEEVMNQLADSVLKLSEEEVIAEECEAGDDPTAGAASVLAVLLNDKKLGHLTKLERVRKHFLDLKKSEHVRTNFIPTLRRPVQIVIADDHPIFRDGLRRLLEAEPGLKVIGEASDGAEAVKVSRQLKPDILLLDLAMPKHPGLEALRDLSASVNSKPVRVILLTAAAEKSQIVEALQLGARGVVLKDSATQLLLKAIQTVMSGEYWVGRESVSNLVQYLRRLMQSSSDEARRKKFGLTPRELEIVSAVVAGYSNKEIAEYFKIAEDTVKHHLSNSFDKLGVSTRLELALFAVNQSVPLQFIGGCATS
jgi:DNA-binding NarL/FixJ family response regulator